MKRFIFKIITFIPPIFLLLIVTNYIGDPAKLFDSVYEKNMAEIIINGHFVTNISNYDERVFQKEVISLMRESPKVIVLGSSRSMLINSMYYSGKTFFNNSVSGASIEDIIGIYQIYRERNFMPELILIGIDPWTFNESNGQTRWKSIKYYYESFKNNNSFSESEIYSDFKYKELFSFSYFQASIKKIPKKIFSNLNPLPTSDKYNVTNTKLIDGSLVYGDEYRNATQDAINLKIKNYVAGNIYSIENYSNISKEIWEEFSELVSELNSNDIKVEFFLCPYAPLVFNVMENRYPMVMETENKIRHFANENNITVHGSFDPKALGFNETYFYDGMHCKEKGISIILADEN